LIHRFYLDENVDGAIRDGLRGRGVDVMTVQEDGLSGEPDPVVFDRAEELGRVLFTRDTDFLGEAAARARAGRRFPTVIYGRQVGLTVGQCVSDLVLFTEAAEQSEGWDQVIYLPI
jgi:predicted nuclease of predicted toxin-antitoxin system